MTERFGDMLNSQLQNNPGVWKRWQAEKRGKKPRGDNKEKLPEEAKVDNKILQAEDSLYRVFVDRILQGDLIAQEREERDSMRFFAENNIHVLSTPLLVDRSEEDMLDLDLLHPTMATRRVVDEHIVDTTVGQRRTEKYSHPIIQRKIAYQIWLCIDGSSMQLEGISVFKGARVLQVLLEELAELQVENEDDLFAARDYLTSLYFSLTNKK